MGAYEVFLRPCDKYRNTKWPIFVTRPWKSIFIAFDNLKTCLSVLAQILISIPMTVPMRTATPFVSSSDMTRATRHTISDIPRATRARHTSLNSIRLVTLCTINSLHFTLRLIWHEEERWTGGQGHFVSLNLIIITSKSNIKESFISPQFTKPTTIVHLTSLLFKATLYVWFFVDGNSTTSRFPGFCLLSTNCRASLSTCVT